MPKGNVDKTVPVPLKHSEYPPNVQHAAPTAQFTAFSNILDLSCSADPNQELIRSDDSVFLSCKKLLDFWHT